jgi:hypothetical protein
VEAYSNISEVFKLPVSFTYPVPVWSLARRKTMLRDENDHYRTGRGTRRRDAAELNVRDMLAWMRALLHEQPVRGRVKRQSLVGSSSLYTQLGRCSPGMFDLRGKIRAGISWLVEHGPASGWAVPNREYATESTSNFTPYYIPRGSLYVAERWVRIGVQVARLVHLFSSLLARLSPAPRSPEAETPTAKKQDSVPTRQERDSTGSRTQSEASRGGPPESVRAVIERARAKQPPECRPPEQEGPR